MTGGGNKKEVPRKGEDKCIVRGRAVKSACIASDEQGGLNQVRGGGKVR